MSGPLYDVAVIGAGHNGLTCAALLAKRGRRVVVLERRHQAGGMAAAEEVSPGLRGAGPLRDTSGFRSWIAAELGLSRFGLRMRAARPPLLVLGDGAALLLDPDPERGARELRAVSARDAERYAAFRAVLGDARRVLGGWQEQPPPDLVDGGAGDAWSALRLGARARRLGGRRMLELLRALPMPLQDFLSDWFESDLLRAGLALPALAGTRLAPRSPGGTTNLLLRESAAGPGVEGGAPALVAALEGAARGLGVEIRTAAAVTGILFGADGLRGVELADGGEVRARRVAAACDPRQTVLRLLPPGVAPDALTRRMEGFRCRGTTALVLFALKAPPRFPAAPERLPEHVAVAPGLEAIERAFDPVKYRALGEAPVLELYLSPAGDPGAPAEAATVVSALAHFVPRDLDGGWDDGARHRLGEIVTTVLERHAPGLAGSVVARVVLTPADLEERYGATGGHLHHGEQALDQILVRPAPGCTGYRTPVPGLFLCGSGSHPGGGISGVPGALAARAILSS